MFSAGWWSKRDLTSVHPVFRKCVESDWAVSTSLRVQWSFPPSDPWACPFMSVWQLHWKLPKRARRTKVSGCYCNVSCLFWRLKTPVNIFRFRLWIEIEAGLVVLKMMLICIREQQWFLYLCTLKTVFLILGKNPKCVFFIGKLRLILLPPPKSKLKFRSITLFPAPIYS